MIPFLKQVAQVYADNEADNLVDYCFVFPNKRSATFFSAFLAETLDNNVIAPATTTISDFVASLSPLVEANRYEQLFTLYNRYRELPGVDIDFDRFIFWGEMLINDFNDVDRYLVDPRALFVNVKKLREISSTYLSPQQLKVIERFWGENSPHQHVEHFWKHLDYSDATESQSKFLKLWEVLLPLYNAFNADLAERGLSSNGQLYRNAATLLDGDNAESLLEAKRYIFVGFNVLSTSEIQIFSLLQKMGMADFYWDFNSPALRMTDNRARRFITKNIDEFPSRFQLDEQPIETMPHIDIVGIPSAIGQVKAAGEQIDRWVADGTIPDPSNAIDTAVVLPDESLFIPMIHSIPSSIETLNVTMGFPMKLSPVAALIRQAVSLQLRVRNHHGEPAFFYEDVKPLLASPLIMSADPAGCNNLAEEIQTKHLFQVPASTIVSLVPALAPVFTPIGNMASIASVMDYVDSLCAFLKQQLGETDRIGSHFIDSYRAACLALCNAAVRFGIDIHGFALFQLVERAVNSDSVNFVGEPLSGLQIMGVLETRALDFDNIIMLSMNERVFPRKLYTRSFIPDALRRGYGMATLDFQESIFAYYFYRLLARAKNVTLIYDARRVGGNKSNEISRYLAQLLYIFGDKSVKHTLGLYTTLPFDTETIEIEKDSRILGLLKEFTPEGGNKNLSASAINTFINCPLQFYLQYVEGFGADDEITDYVDFSTFGSILHEVMERFYGQFQTIGPDGKPRPVEITEQMLKDTIDDPVGAKLDRLITRTINKIFNHYPPDKLLTPLSGETLVLSRVFKKAVIEMLKVDRGYTPFIFVAAEYKMSGTLRINHELTVNVRQIIDRIDEVGGTTRFVDYKTGDDAIDASSVAELFDGNRDKRAKALTQLMMYCHIFRNINSDSRPITPVVYKMRTLMTEGVKLSQIGTRNEKKTVWDYNEFHSEFEGLLNDTIARIFDPNTPFTQATTSHHCKFCHFKGLCSRNEE